MKRVSIDVRAGLQGDVLKEAVAYRVLKQVHPDTGATAEAKAYLTALLTWLKGRFGANIVLGDLVVNSAPQQPLVAPSIGSDPGPKLEAILPPALAKHAASEAGKAATRLTSSYDARPKNLTDLVDTVAMRAILEYMAAELWELSGNFARDNKRQRITRRDLDVAIANDPELAQVFYDVTPPASMLIGILPKLDEKQKKERGSPRVTAKQVKSDLTATFPGKSIEASAIESIQLLIGHLYKLFSQVSDAQLEAWLETIPVPDTSVELHTRLYRKVMGLIAGALLIIAATPEHKEITYADLVRAVTENPYFNLTPYLRGKTFG